MLHSQIHHTDELIWRSKVVQFGKVSLQSIGCSPLVVLTDLNEMVDYVISPRCYREHCWIAMTTIPVFDSVSVV